MESKHLNFKQKNRSRNGHCYRFWAEGKGSFLVYDFFMIHTLRYERLSVFIWNDILFCRLMIQLKFSFFSENFIVKLMIIMRLKTEFYVGRKMHTSLCIVYEIMSNKNIDQKLSSIQTLMILLVTNIIAEHCPKTDGSIFHSMKFGWTKLAIKHIYPLRGRQK